MEPDLVPVWILTMEMFMQKKGNINVSVCVILNSMII